MFVSSTCLDFLLSNTCQRTHEKVKRRALDLVAMWATEFGNGFTLAPMVDCYNNLKAKSRYSSIQDIPPFR